MILAGWSSPGSGLVLSAVLAALLVAAPVPAAADSLLRGGLGAGCAWSMICPGSKPVRSVAADPDKPKTDKIADIIVRDCTELPTERQVTFGCGPAAPKPEAVAPVPRDARIGGSVTARSAFVRTPRGEAFAVSMLPRFDIERHTRQSDFVFGAEAEFVKESGTEDRLASGALDFDASYSPDGVTTFGGGMEIGLRQGSPLDRDVVSGAAAAPAVASVAGDARLRRRFGDFEIEARGRMAREDFSATPLAGGGSVSNDDRSRLGLGGGIRLGYRIAENAVIYLDGAAERNIHDAARAGLGARLDNWTMAVRAGVEAAIDKVLVLKASAGYGLRRFDNSLLEDVPALLADAELVYTPQDKLELSALFTTSLGVPGVPQGASAELAYSVLSSARFHVTDRLALRASAGGRWLRYAGSGGTETAYRAGLGTDYDLSATARLSADYGYEVVQPNGGGTEQSHAVTLGVTYSP